MSTNTRLPFFRFVSCIGVNSVALSLPSSEADVIAYLSAKGVDVKTNVAGRDAFSVVPFSSAGIASSSTEEEPLGMEALDARIARYEPLESLDNRAIALKPYTKSRILAMKFSAAFLGISLLLSAPAWSRSPGRVEALDAMKSAVTFFREHAGYQGAYVFRVSSDLHLREGEGKANAGTGWLEPPGTPSVGLAFLQAYQLTGEDYLLDAATEAADALIKGQLASGGWTESVELLPSEADRYAYRSHGKTEKRRNTSTLDDDKTQSALRFLMRLDHQTQSRDHRLYEAVTYALEKLLDAQYPNGAWPQRFSEPFDPKDFPVKSASYPDSWSRTYPNEKYAHYYTLNDNTISDTINTMLLAYDIYGNERYLHSALSGGDFFLRAQMPDPQPGWAQQYNVQMHPVWARKFEPPAISGGESQGVIRTLLMLYQRTGRKDYLDAATKALDYFGKSRRSDGRLARFYELKTNRPLYFTKHYQLTYSDADMPTHYGFIVGGNLDSIRQQAGRLAADHSLGSIERIQPKPPEPLRARSSKSLAEKASYAMKALDDRGAWVEKGEMRNYDNPTGEVVQSKTFANRLLDLARYIHTAPR